MENKNDTTNNAVASSSRPPLKGKRNFRSNSNNNNNKKDKDKPNKGSSSNTKARRRNRNRNKANRGPPATPQVKLVLRNIYTKNVVAAVAGNNGNNNDLAIQASAAINQYTFDSTPALVKWLREVVVERANAQLHQQQQQQQTTSNNATTTTNHVSLVLDEVSCQQAILAENAYNEPKAKWLLTSNNDDDEKIENAAADEKSKDENDKIDDANNKSSSNTKVNGKSNHDTVSNDFENKLNNRKDSVDSTTVFDENTLVLRWSYVILPKSTRRRGEKPGCLYLVLQAPRINAKPANTTKPVQNGIDVNVNNNGVVTGGNNEDKINKATFNPNEKNNNGNKINSNDTMRPPDYSAELARCTLLLQKTVQILQKVVGESEKNGQNNRFVGGNNNNIGNQQQQQLTTGLKQRQQYQIQPNLRPQLQLIEAMNQKLFKPFCDRFDRRQNTIETTEDYKNYFSNQTRTAETLQARPKPVPGGGINGGNSNNSNNVNSNSTTFNSGNNTNVKINNVTDAAPSGAPMAALVQHLQAKRLEAQQKTQRQQKAQEQSKKSSDKKKKSNIEPPEEKANTNEGKSTNKRKKKSSNKKRSSTSIPSDRKTTQYASNGNGIV